MQIAKTFVQTMCLLFIWQPESIVCLTCDFAFFKIN